MPEVLSAVNAQGLVDSCQHLYDDDQLTGVFARKGLNRLSQATGTRHLGQFEFARIERGAKGRWGLLGPSVLQTQNAPMRPFFRIRDAGSGAVACEGTDELTVSVETSRERAVTLQAVARETAADFSRQLP